MEAMDAPRIDPTSDTPENGNEEFGRGDQGFGGGPGEVEYGEQDPHVGEDGVVAEGSYLGRRPAIITDDEREGVALPGSDDSEQGVLQEEEE